MNIKENFTYTKKNPQDQVIFKWKSLIKWLSKNNLVQLFSLFFITFEHLSHVLTLRTLGSLYVNGSEEGCAHFTETLTSTYGMKLKLGPVIALDIRRRYITLSPKNVIYRHSVERGLIPPFLSDPPFLLSLLLWEDGSPLMHLYGVVILGCFHITPRVWLKADTDTDWLSIVSNQN